MQVYHPAFGSSVAVRAEVLPDDGDAQTARTIERMVELARQDAAVVPVFRESDGWAYLDAVFEFVKRRVRFVPDRQLAQVLAGKVDPATAEVLIRPRDLLRMANPQGDCDDFSMLAGALLLARGIHCAFVAVAADPDDPAMYSHVYVAAYLGDRRVPLDCSHGSQAGWEVRNRFGKRREWRIGPMVRFRAGLNGLVCDDTGDNCWDDSSASAASPVPSSSVPLTGPIAGWYAGAATPGPIPASSGATVPLTGPIAQWFAQSPGPGPAGASNTPPWYATAFNNLVSSAGVRLLPSGTLIRNAQGTIAVGGPNAQPLSFSPFGSSFGTPSGISGSTLLILAALALVMLMAKGSK